MKPMDPQQPGAIMILAEGQGRHVGPCRRGQGERRARWLLLGVMSVQPVSLRR